MMKYMYVNEQKTAICLLPLLMRNHELKVGTRKEVNPLRHPFLKYSFFSLFPYRCLNSGETLIFSDSSMKNLLMAQYKRSEKSPSHCPDEARQKESFQPVQKAAGGAKATGGCLGGLWRSIDVSECAC